MIDTTGWPAAYIDDDGRRHAWTDVVPPDPGDEVSGGPDASSYTYADLIVDQVGAQGMSVDEYFEVTGYGDDEDQDLGYESEEDDL